MSNSASKIVAYLVAIPVVLLIYIGVIIYFTWANAVVLTHLWAWFAVPLGLPTLSL